MLVYLVRHAEAARNGVAPYHLPPGPGLTPAGLAQATAAGEVLASCGIERVVASPMRRCAQTADAISVALHVPVVVEDDLGELQPNEAPDAVAVRMLRAALSYACGGTVALVSHAAPLERLLVTATRDELVLPPPDARGCHIREGEVWELLLAKHYRRGRPLRPGGVRA